MAPIGSRHAGTVNRATRFFVRAVGDRALVQIQNPVRLNDLSETVPDVALLRPRADDYTASHPEPDDTLLIIEVADTSIGYDRGRKSTLYALAEIPEYWLVNLHTDEIEVRRSPSPSGYGDIAIHGRGSVLRTLAFPDLEVPADAILP
jgi:Uma2 family endonuclease